MTELSAGLSDSRLRVNPLYKLVSYDELRPEDQFALQDLAADKDFYGVLVAATGPSVPVKTVSCDAALLLQTLRSPARVPRLLHRLFGVDADTEVGRLILDGVLQCEFEGEFTSRPRPTVVGEDPAPLPHDDLSLSALKYAAACLHLPFRDLAARLYMYNREPSTPQLFARFAEPHQVLAYLVSGSQTLERTLRAHWSSTPSKSGAWMSWRIGDVSSALTCKLYLSPKLEALPQVFESAVEVLARTGCLSFKVGLSAHGLLRPDKLVAYFQSLDQLQAAAEQIHLRTTGVPAQGVPFSGSIDPNGLLGWGMDPPRLQGDSKSAFPRSWRQWVTERAALYLSLAYANRYEEPVRFALDGLKSDGVDTSTWTPDLAIWRRFGGLAGDVA